MQHERTGWNPGVQETLRRQTKSRRVCVCLCFHRKFPSLVVSKQCRDQIQPKMLTKQIFRLMEKFNVDQGVLSADHV